MGWKPRPKRVSGVSPATKIHKGHKIGAVVLSRGCFVARLVLWILCLFVASDSWPNDIQPIPAAAALGCLTTWNRCPKGKWDFLSHKNSQTTQNWRGCFVARLVLWILCLFVASDSWPSDVEPIPAVAASRSLMTLIPCPKDIRISLATKIHKRHKTGAAVSYTHLTLPTKA